MCDTASELYNEMLGIYFDESITYQMQKEVKWTIVNGLEKN